MLLQNYDPNRPTRDDVFHSNGYADAQSPARIGAVSRETFEQRRALERTVVRGYSGMTHVHSGLHPETSSPSHTTQRFQRQQLPTTHQRISFREPQGRGYNPYS